MYLSDGKSSRGNAVQDFRFPELEKAEPSPQVSPYDFQSWGFGTSVAEGPCHEEARLSAEELLAQAQKKAQEIEQRAYEEGFRQGQADGLEVGRRALRELIRRFEALVTGLEKEREELFRRREQDLVELVLLIAEKILARELAAHPEAIRGIIREGFRQLSTLERVELFVSPPDFEILEQEGRGDWPPGVELRADPGLSPGGFRLRHSLGEVDGTRETRWHQISEAVRKAAGMVYESSPRD